MLGVKFKTVTTKKEYTIEEFYNTIKDHSFSAGAPALTKHGLSTIIAFPPLDRHNQVWIMPYLTFKKTSTSKFQVSKNDVAGMGNAAVNIALSDLTGGLTNFRGMLGRYAKAAEKLVDMTAGELNEKVIDYIFFSNKEPDNNEDSTKSFERMSKYNIIRGEVFISGDCVSIIEDSGFTNVEQVITQLLSAFPEDVERPIKVQIRITNMDKKQTQLYQRILQ